MLRLEDYEKIIEKCSHCSYCQSTCPSYLTEQSESSVAKNRLLIIKETLMHKNLPFTPFTIKVPTFKDKVYNIKDAGAIGDGVFKCTNAINSTIKK